LFSRWVARRLRDSDRRLVQFATSDALGRVASRLVQLCDEHGSVDDQGAIHIELPLTNARPALGHDRTLKNHIARRH
jgi:hypothetical protein